MTLTQAADFLAPRLGDTSTARKTLIKDDLNQIVRKMLSKKEDWAFMEASHSFNTIASTSEYTLDDAAGGVGKTDIRRFLLITYRDERRTLDPRDIGWFERTYPDPADHSGPPIDYTVWANKLVLGPTPDDVYTLNYRYYKTFTSLTDGQSPPWVATANSDEFDHVWLAGAWAVGLQLNDDARAQGKWAEFFQSLSNLTGDDALMDEDIEIPPFSMRDSDPLIGSHLV